MQRNSIVIFDKTSFYSIWIPYGNLFTTYRHLPSLHVRPFSQSELHEHARGSKQ